MAEITVEEIDTHPPVAEPVAEAVEPVAEPVAPVEPPPLERQSTVAFQTSEGEVTFAAAPKKRGRPKGKAKPKEPKVKPQPVSVEEPYVEQPQPVIDVNALMEPIFKAYMATHEMRKREQRNARYHDLFSGMTGY